MKKFLTTFLSLVAVVVFVFGMPWQSAALVLSGTSLLDGTAREIIGAPEDISNGSAGATNLQQEAFNERQGVTLTRDIEFDDGWIAEGTRVDSHMIFLNAPLGESAIDFFVEWVFDGEILGVMSDAPGKLEAASTDLLGHLDTEYPEIQPDGSLYPSRGLRKSSNPLPPDADGYLFSDSTLTLNMKVSRPGDWIRVVTAAGPIPEPGTLILFGSGLFGLLILMRRKLRKRI
jgi:hypothetical protein